MAGAGSRFKAEGYALPKPFIDIKAPQTLNVLKAKLITNWPNIETEAIFQILLLKIAAFIFLE